MWAGRWLRGVLWALALVAPVTGQEMVATKIVFDQPGPFAQTDLEAVAGLHPGQVVSLKDLQAAAQRLADTGCFEDVRMDSKGSPRALTIVFLLRPTVGGALYPIRYENFLWATPQEVEAEVHRSVPLFHTSLPETASVLDTAGASLQAMLVRKGVNGAEVTHEVVPASSSEPQTTVIFRVSRPSVTLHSVSLQAAPGPLVDGLKRTATKLEGAPYVSGDRAGSTAALLLKPYRDAGYLEARLADLKSTLTAQGPGKVVVDLSGSVESGPIFRFGTIQYAATPVFSQQAFESESKLRTGGEASQSLLMATEEPVEAAYHKLGYMYAYVDPHETRDAAAHTVSYALQPVPGEQYKLKSMQVQGLPPDASALLQSAWKMQPGDPYNADYVEAFLHNNSALRGLEGYAGTYQATADPNTHGVDLTMLFARTNGR